VYEGRAASEPRQARPRRRPSRLVAARPSRVFFAPPLFFGHEQHGFSARGCARFTTHGGVVLADWLTDTADVVSHDRDGAERHSDFGAVILAGLPSVRRYGQRRANVRLTSNDCCNDDTRPQ